MKKQQSGFTLIELMIVVAIIGILAAIALPAYQDYTKRAHVTEGLQLASAAKLGVAEFYASEGVWPTSNEAVGLPATITDINGNAVKSVEITTPDAAGTTAVITITYNSKVEDDKKITLTATAATGSIQWNCAPDGTAGVNPKYLPATCRS